MRKRAGRACRGTHHRLARGGFASLNLKIIMENIMRTCLPPKVSSASLALAITFALAAQVASSHSAEASSLDINVQNIQSQKGALMVAVYENQNEFDQNKALQGQRIAVNGQSLKVHFSSLPPGTYAVKMFHDVNGNNRLDTQDDGIPVEPFGFSNDAPAKFGPASWKDARFDVHAGENRQTIHLTKIAH